MGGILSKVRYANLAHEDHSAHPCTSSRILCGGDPPPAAATKRSPEPRRELRAELRRKPRWELRRELRRRGVDGSRNAVDKGPSLGALSLRPQRHEHPPFMRTCAPSRAALTRGPGVAIEIPRGRKDLAPRQARSGGSGSRKLIAIGGRSVQRNL